MNDDVVIPQQDAVRVYATNGGDIAVHQQDGVGEESVIYLSPQHAKALCKAIRGLAKQMLEGDAQ